MTPVHPAVAAERRARRNRRADFWGRLAAHAIAVLTAGWLFMFAVGMVHHEWIVQCPTLGYLESTALAAMLRAALTPIPSTKSR